MTTMNLPVIMTPQAAFSLLTLNGTLREITLVLDDQLLPRNIHGQWSVYQSTMEVDFNSIGSKYSRSQPRPPL